MARHLYLYQNLGCARREELNDYFKIAAFKAESASDLACGCGELAMVVPRDKVAEEIARGKVLHPMPSDTSFPSYMCVPRESYWTAPLEVPRCDADGRMPAPQPPIDACAPGQFPIMRFQDFGEPAVPTKNVQQKGILRCRPAEEMRCGQGELAMDLPDYVNRMDEYARLGIRSPFAYGSGAPTYSDLHSYTLPFRGEYTIQHPYICISEEKYAAIPAGDPC